MGQSNMLGFGKIPGDSEGALEYAVLHKKCFPYLMDEETGKWRTHPRVRNVRVTGNSGNTTVHQNEWLTVKGKRFGPEIEIGWILGHLLEDDEPILLLKSCVGNRSLGWDLLPPGSERVEVNGTVYAGYKDSPGKWKVGTEQPEPAGNWYGGKQYDGDTANVKAVLGDLGKYYPGANEYEIAGFFFWQGHKDTGDKVHAANYEKNLVQLIHSLRKDFEAPNAPFVCATVGFQGRNMKGSTLQVWEAQMAVDGDSGNYPVFKGNVQTVDIRDSWRNVGKAGHHYGMHAETYMEVGNAMGMAMAGLVLKWGTKV